MFQLLIPTVVKLMHINVRTEKHGPTDIDACDLDFLLSGENARVLGLLHPDLCEHLYFNAEADAGQEGIDVLPRSLPNLRFPKLADALPWHDEATGVDLTVIYGLGDDESNIKLEAGKSATKRIEPEEGGTASLAFRFSVAGYPDGVIDKLRKKLKQEVSITMVRPEKLRADAVIDGTVGHEGVARMQAEGQGSLLDDQAGDAGEEAGDAFARLSDDEGPGEPDDADDEDDGSAPDLEPQAGKKRRGRRVAAATH